MILDYCKNGLPIQYDSGTNEIIYKTHRVLFNNLKLAYESNRDRINLGNELTMFRRSYMVSFGCLELSHHQCKSIIDKVCKKSS